MRLTIVTGFFLPVPPLRGGSTEKIWYRLALEFVRSGHFVTFISRAWPGFRYRECADGVNHIRLNGADHKRSLISNLWHDFVWGIRVARALPVADVVVCNTVTLPVWLRWLKRSAGRVVAVIARKPKGHGRFYGNVDLFLSLSTAVTGALTRENPGLSDRIAPFPYPIDWPLHARASNERVGSDRVTIGYIGRIHPEKGLTLLLDACAELGKHDNLPRWRLVLVGPSAVAEGGRGDDYKRALLARIDPRLRPHVEFRPPEFDPTKLATLYAQMDIFCYPSIAERGETFGVAIAEAMAARCAPIVSDLECFRELVSTEKNGLVFDHRQPNAEISLATAIEKLLRDPVLRHNLAQRAQEHVRQYDYPEIAALVLAHFARITADAHPNR